MEKNRVVSRDVYIISYDSKFKNFDAGLVCPLKLRGDYASR